MGNRIFSKIVEKKSLLIVLILFCLAIFFFLVNVGFGAVSLSPLEIIKALFLGDNDKHRQIIFNIRLPRTIVAMLVGSALATSGVILQGVMNNPLATPNIIGVSSGAGLMAIVIMVLFPHYFYLVPVGAFIGAFFASMIIYSLAWKDGILPTRLILAGVATNTIFGAGNDILLSFYPDRVSNVISFLVGGLNGVNWNDVKMITPYILTGLIIMIFMTEKLNVLLLGDEVAIGLGLKVEKTRLVLIVISSLLAGSAVSAVGLLGFVGLIVPHIARIFVGSDYKYLYPASIFLGATVVQAADLAARLIFAPKEIPVGIIMSIIGGPFFLYLLRRKEFVK